MKISVLYRVTPLLLILVLALTACQPAAQAVPTLAPAPTSTLTASSTAVPPTATVAPAATLAPSSPTAVPVTGSTAAPKPTKMMEDDYSDDYSDDSNSNRNDNDNSNENSNDNSNDATGAVVNMVTSDALGPYLVDEKGMTLYLFTKDTPGVTTCFEGCLAAWPALLTIGQPIAGEGVDDSDLSTITRPDGAIQVTYRGLPLYYYTPDLKPGDTFGQGVGEVWFVVEP